MILVMDVGNTNIKCGVFDNGKKMHSWRVATNRVSTSDEYGITFVDLFRYTGLHIGDVKGAIISSVVPTINYTLEHMIQTFFKVKPIIVGPGIKTGIALRYDNPRELGSDRIVNAVATHALYGGPAIIIDFGTATSFGAISEKGEFLGGCICPGLKVASDALVERTARLMKVELDRPANVINRSTVTNLQSGIIYGYIGQVEYIVRRMRREMGCPDVRVVATGGLASLIAAESDAIHTINPELTLIGLNILYQRNAPDQ
nr:type III pantothenate kinase [bacterium]